MDTDFSVTPVRGSDCLVLVLEGDLDTAVTPKLEAALDAARATGLDVIIDLTSLTFIDSTGLHALLREPRPVALVRIPGSNIARVLDIVNAGKAVVLCDDLAEAVERRNSGRPQAVDSVL